MRFSWAMRLIHLFPKRLQHPEVSWLLLIVLVKGQRLGVRMRIGLAVLIHVESIRQPPGVAGLASRARETGREHIMVDLLLTEEGIGHCSRRPLIDVHLSDIHLHSGLL